MIKTFQGDCISYSLKISLFSPYFHSFGSDVSDHFFWSEYRVNRTGDFTRWVVNFHSTGVKIGRGQLSIHFINTILSFYNFLLNSLVFHGPTSNVEHILPGHILISENEVVSVTEIAEKQEILCTKKMESCPQPIAILTITLRCLNAIKL